jgi:kinesin family protein C2/C3
MGFWRLKSPNHLMGYVPNSGKYVTRHKSMNSMCDQARRKGGHPDIDYLGDRDILSSPDLSVNPLIFDRDSRAALEGMLYNSHFDQNGRGNGDADEALSDMHMSDSTSAWLQHIGHKFREVLQVKIRQMQDMPTATDAGISVSVDNAYFHSLSSFISAILGDKPAEEVPMLVEVLLRKVIEEFEYHLLTQRKQVTEMGKKLMEEEKRVNEEEADRLLKESHEPDCMMRPDEEELLALEKQKRELVESKHRICTLELQLQDAQRKMHEIEMNSASLETKYEMFLFHQTEEYKNLRSAQHGAKEEVVRMQMEWKYQLSSLEKELQAMARAASGYHKVLAENRALYNEVQDLKGNIRVYCRVRPFLSDEPGRPTTVDYIGENGEIVLVNPSQQGGKDSRKAFAFNKVFGTMASQEEVFMDTQPLIRSVLDGYNVCIFAYGQTGSGKTFTMNGPNNMTPFNWGVNYRALHDLFHLTQSRLDVFHYEIGVQMLEIYNEQVRDLLNTDGVQRKLEIRNSSQLNGSNVPDASMMTVRSTEDVLELMKVGQKNRAVGATALNDRSSRSHSILTIHIQGTDLDSGTTLRGSLHLVDLAGSERVDKSEATGDRLKEAQHINKSLSALGDVIAALAQKSGHVPYRNSKLTQLLQDSLGVFDAI